MLNVKLAAFWKIGMKYPLALVPQLGNFDRDEIMKPMAGNCIKNTERPLFTTDTKRI
jgi:hypothetical protein